MGRGTFSGRGGGGAKNTASQQPFSVTDWKTWPVGTKVYYDSEGDIIESGNDLDEIARTSSVLYDGTVVEVHPDHLIVDVPTISDHMWLDNNTADLFRAKKKK